MIWHTLASWLSLFLPTFYRRIHAHNIRHLHTSDPVIIAMNHPNAFTDPIAFSYVTYPIRLHYMARGDAFKPGIVTWLLEQIGIVPIFRLQDGGRDGLKKNDVAYRRVNHLLGHNGKVMVFAEGLCVQERRLRPLKKGVARMVFGAYDHLGHDRLRVIPVGVNYSKPHQFRSTLLYNVGPPMSVKDYMTHYRENPARAMNLFLDDLEKEMLKVVVHIPEPDLDEVVHYAEKLQMNEEMLSAGDDPKLLISEFNASKRLVSRIAAFKQRDPAALDTFRTLARSYFEELDRHGMRDWLLRPRRQKKNTQLVLVARWVAFALMLPVYITGMAFNLPPLALTRSVTKRLVKVVEFYSSFFFGLAMVIFPLVYAVWFLLAYAAVSNLFGALGILLVGALCGWATLHIHPFLLRTLGLGRFLSKPSETARLKEMRAALVATINKF